MRRADEVDERARQARACRGDRACDRARRLRSRCPRPRGRSEDRRASERTRWPRRDQPLGERPPDVAGGAGDEDIARSGGPRSCASIRAARRRGCVPIGQTRCARARQCTAPRPADASMPDALARTRIPLRAHRAGQRRARVPEQAGPRDERRRATSRRRARCIRRSTAASTGTRACTCTGCSRACCDSCRDLPEARRDRRDVRRAPDAAKRSQARCAISARAEHADVRAHLRLGVAAEARARSSVAATTRTFARWQAQPRAARRRVRRALSRLAAARGAIRCASACTSNTAFGLAFALDYARAAGDDALAAACEAKALDWYAQRPRLSRRRGSPPAPTSSRPR